MSTTPDFESMQKEIEELKHPQQNRQFEMVPEKAEKSQTPETKSIVKPTGNYTNIAKVLKLNNEEFNGYKSNIRDIVEACPPKKQKKETEVSSKKNKVVIPRDKNKVVASSSKTVENLSDDKSDNNDDNVDVDNTNTSRNKKNERKKSGRISNQSRKGNN
ncbi:hypothetical protein RclHR1_16580004 [Rhizophagus clarus]|uniref:Uncharacterized protein n=1 Tax=Rhizophagus clarus TaxID=94130 RepID=A0A2Z6QHX4_9GLOM|nr:hypothetical protein RclHR1_16580004 [Rhizophagus clarus]